MSQLFQNVLKSTYFLFQALKSNAVSLGFPTRFPHLLPPLSSALVFLNSRSLPTAQGVSCHCKPERRELPLTPSSSTRAGVQSSLVHSFELRASDGAPPRCLREGKNGWSKLTKVVLAISEKHCFSVNARLKSASCWTIKIIYSSCLQLLIMNKNVWTPSVKTHTQT